MSWLSNLFGGNQKRDTTYTGQKPVMSLAEVPGGKEYYDSISGRLKGHGVGYGDTYANEASSPIIARMRNQFSSYDVPELQSQLSATGRRKSSGGFDQLRRAYTDQSLAEGDVYANLYRENEGQKRTEVNDALARMGAYASDNANLVNNRANFDTADYKNQLTQAQGQRDAGNAAFGRLLGTAALGLQGASGFGGMQSAMPQFSSTDYNANMFVPWGQGGSMNDRLARKKIMQSGGVSPVRTRQN